MKSWKRIFSIAIFAAGAFLGGGASAAGWIESISGGVYQGWACNPSSPGYSGWIHFWRDDNKFLGALHAGIQREDAVGAICNDSGVHGFSGELNIPIDYFDNKTHTVRAYFINQDDSPALELQNLYQVLFRSPTYFEYQKIVSGRCVRPDSYFEDPNWLWRKSAYSDIGPCQPPLISYDVTREHVYIGDPSIPVGASLEVCDWPTNVSKLGSRWQIVSTKSSTQCISYFQTNQVGNYPPTIYNINYRNLITIKKVGQ